MRRSLTLALLVTVGLAWLQGPLHATAAATIRTPLAEASHAAVQAVPQLYINKDRFCSLFDPSWAITVSNADASSDVVLEEYRWDGTTWQETWNGVVTTTDGSGNAYWNHFGPAMNGYFYAQVRVNGMLSNPVSYRVAAPC